MWILLCVLRETKYRFRIIFLQLNGPALVGTISSLLNSLAFSIPHLAVPIPHLAIPIPHLAVFIPRLALPIPQFTVFIPHLAVPIPYLAIFIPHLALPILQLTVFIPHLAVFIPYLQLLLHLFLFRVYSGDVYFRISCFSRRAKMKRRMDQPWWDKCARKCVKRVEHQGDLLATRAGQGFCGYTILYTYMYFLSIYLLYTLCFLLAVFFIYFTTMIYV